MKELKIIYDRYYKDITQRLKKMFAFRSLSFDKIFFFIFSSYKIFNRWHLNKTLFCFRKPQYQTFFCRRCGLSLLNSMRKGRQSRMAQLVDHWPVFKPWLGYDYIFLGQNSMNEFVELIVIRY